MPDAGSKTRPPELAEVPVAPRDRIPREERLRITEVFHSLQGEARTAGYPTVFVRLTGCPLRCVYCDTEYAFYGGEWTSIDEVVSQARDFGAPFVTVTGGEPMAQKNCRRLLSRLCDTGAEVSLETGGAMNLAGLDSRVVVVMDLKTPASGEMKRNRWDNLDHLRPGDQVKFVICDRDDYEWARARVEEYRLADRFEVLFSPSHGVLPPSELADWILADRLPVRFQVQLHKYIWGDEPGR